MARQTGDAARRSPCPLACTLDLIGDRWTLLIVRDLLRGLSQFNEFTRSPEAIATNILADRLTRLAEHGLVEKRPSSISPRRDVYSLTPKGKSLRPILEQIASWGLTNIPGTAAHLRPPPTKEL
jgi:DNA-binding HxlR family transcriptional regulator